MSFLLDIINGINKFLGYLDISPKYLNRGYTILSFFPTLYILRIVYGMYENGNYLQCFIYAVVFFILLYFLILNSVYYFLDKNSKLDVTQLFVKYLPDEAFNIQQEKRRERAMKSIDTEEVAIDFYEDYQLYLATYMQDLIDQKVVSTNDLSLKDGYLVEWNTIYPFYFVKEKGRGEYELQIGRNYQELTPIGIIHYPNATQKLKPVGLYIIGGDFVKEGFRYHEPYRLKLLAKKARPAKTEQPSRMERRAKKK
jgi:hypothetical protein